MSQTTHKEIKLALFDHDDRLKNIEWSNRPKTEQLQTWVGGEYETHDLLSGDLLIFNINQVPDVLPRNNLASAVSGKEFFGPCVLCAPNELD